MKRTLFVVIALCAGVLIARHTRSMPSSPVTEPFDVIDDDVDEDEDHNLDDVTR